MSASTTPATPDALADVVRGTFGDLSGETRHAIVVLLQCVSTGQPVARVVVEGDDDPLLGPGLEQVIASIPPVRTRELVDRAKDNLGMVTALRAQYRRAPGLAQGAIERACATGLWTAGLPRQDAAPVARTLLRLDRDDWERLADALSDIDRQLPAAS